MDWQVLFNLIGGALLTAVGWWCREIWDSVKALKKDLQTMEVDLPKTYVSKIEINARFDKIDATLERIFDKLDAKADK
jgi:molybdenum cofactor biosynthesis enzyme